MAYRIGHIEPTDFDTLVPPMFDAFGTHYEFVNALYPDHDTPRGRRAIVAKFRSMHKAAANTHWIKAVDTASGQAVGLAMWTSIEREEEKPPEKDLDGPPGTWPSEEVKEYCRAMHRDVVAGRRKLIREEEVPIVVLSMMVVFDEHQRRGVGKMLLDWGLCLVSEKNALCCVDSTPVARKLYESGGFVVERDFNIDAGERYKDKPKDRCLFMVRPRSRRQ